MLLWCTYTIFFFKKKKIERLVKIISSFNQLYCYKCCQLSFTCTEPRWFLEHVLLTKCMCRIQFWKQYVISRRQARESGESEMVLSSHDMDSWWIIHPLLWTTSLGSDPTRSQPRPFHGPVLLLRERYLSLLRCTVSHCLSTWVGGPRVHWLLVFRWRRPLSALEEVKSNPAVGDSSKRQETIEGRLKIHLIFFPSMCTE